MRPWRDRAVLRGRIHGRLLLVLIVVAALASLTAIWQFGVLRDDDGPDFADFGGGEPSAPSVSGDPDSPTASASPTPTATPESSPASTGAEPGNSNAAHSSAPADAATASSECTASLTLDNEWDASVSVTVTVANTGAEAIDGWEIVLDLRNLTVTTTWGLSHVEGDRYSDILFNAAVGPGDSVEPSFQADIDGDFELPATVPCTPAG